MCILPVFSKITENLLTKILVTSFLYSHDNIKEEPQPRAHPSSKVSAAALYYQYLNPFGGKIICIFLLQITQHFVSYGL